MKGHKGFYTRDQKPKDYETIEIDITYEQYFFLNEEARAKGITLDEHVTNILLEAIKKLGEKDAT